MKVGDKVFVAAPHYVTQILNGFEPVEGTIVERHDCPSGTIFVVQFADGSRLDNAPHTNNVFMTREELELKIRLAIGDKKAEEERISSEIKTLNAYLEKTKETVEKPKGTHGTCTWTINNGVLCIYPTNGIGGQLETPVAFNGRAPWHDHAWEIKKVMVMHGVRTHPMSPYLFAGLPCCTEIDVSALNTEGLTNASHMFEGNINLRRLDISNFNVRRLCHMEYMFRGCVCLEELTLFDIPVCCIEVGKFYDCRMLLTYNAPFGKKIVPPSERRRLHG